MFYLLAIHRRVHRYTELIKLPQKPLEPMHVQSNETPPSERDAKFLFIPPQPLRFILRGKRDPLTSTTLRDSLESKRVSLQIEISVQEVLEPLVSAGAKPSCKPSFELNAV